MTDKPQLDHDKDGHAGGARKAPARTAPGGEDLVWVVNRVRGLHRVAAPDVDGVVRAGGRLATGRDLEIGGVKEG